VATKEEVTRQVAQILAMARDSNIKIWDAATKAVDAYLNGAWPVVATVKTMHNILVAFNGEPANQAYLQALQIYCQRQNGWLATQGLKMRRYTVEAVAVMDAPGKYHFASLVQELMRLKAITFDGKNAYYLWMQSRGLNDGGGIGGTIGGDVFGQKGGRHGNREPGVSVWDVDGVHCLATGRPLNTMRVLTADAVMGAAAHEDGHKFLFPCASGVSGAPHKPECPMERWWAWPTVKYEKQGQIWSDKEPRWQAGNEVKYLIESGFYLAA